MANRFFVNIQQKRQKTLHALNMGLYIKKNKKGIKIFHSVSDEPIHNGYLKTDDEIRKILIENARFDFFEKVVKIDTDLLSGYTINDVRQNSSNEGLQKVIDYLHVEGKLESEAIKILKRLKIKIT